MNVKQGDLAIVIDSDAAADIGIICTVDKYVGQKENKDGRVENAWDVTSVSRPFTFRDGSCDVECTMEDYCLRPVSGIPDTETTDTPVKIEEPAC